MTWNGTGRHGAFSIPFWQSVEMTMTAVVPEPECSALLALAGLALRRRR